MTNSIDIIAIALISIALYGYNKETRDFTIGAMVIYLIIKLISYYS